MRIFQLTIQLILFTSAFAFGQPNLPPPDPDRVPVTGIEYLLIGGGAYGVYRFSKRNKKNEA